LLSAHPEMQQVAKALAADWKSRPASLTPPQIPGYVAELVRKAVDYHVTWQYLDGSKTFVQLPPQP
ncbi:MAG TPA: hypothetical protein V6D23_09065, partial [Candidatus Obscuribacterales bacterium]